MSVILFDFPGATPLGTDLRHLIKAEEGAFISRSFPDGESYLQIENNVKNKEVIICASLFRPNERFLDLIFLADVLYMQGAKRIGFVAPYLAYMRQDKIFHPGEALTSVTFAKLISQYFDFLVTVDPHLHRYQSLNQIYSIPSTVVKAAPLISKWIHEHIESPFIIGPDSESRQWVSEIAGSSPYLVLSKTRFEDGHIEIVSPPFHNINGKTPVLVDDIISSGETLIQAVGLLKKQGLPPPTCIAIHPIFAKNSYQQLRETGAHDIITCNTVPHPSNKINVAPFLAKEIKLLMR